VDLKTTIAPLLYSPRALSNLHGRDLLCKLGAVIDCCPIGLWVTFGGQGPNDVTTDFFRARSIKQTLLVGTTTRLYHVDSVHNLVSIYSHTEPRMCHASMAPWFHGSMVPWFNGSMVQWFHGSMVPWFNCSMVQWFNGSMVPDTHHCDHKGKR